MLCLSKSKYAKIIKLDFFALALAALPLHVWDRELDARILLSALLLNDGHQILLGHEYNISPIYNALKHIYHFGAGRPIYNEPRTNRWYEPIISNGGFVGLVFEEGINDIMKNSDFSFPGINKRSVLSTSKIFSWCQREVTQMSSSCVDDPILSQSLDALSEPVSNTRIELLSFLGSDYFADYINSISTIFGDYVLISDNFGLEIFGVGRPLDKRDEFKWVNDSKKVNELLKFNSEYLNIKAEMRSEFTKVVNSLVKNNPQINFVFRPHPVADPSFWLHNLKPSRNLHVICKDNPVPWIKKALAVIHSGCTVGLEAEFTHIPAIDISRIFNDSRHVSVSSFVSTYKPTTFQELQSSLVSAVSSSNQSKSAAVTNRSISKPFSIEQYLNENIMSLNPKVFTYLESQNFGFPQLSTLLSIRRSYKDFFNSIPSIPPYETNIIAPLIGNVEPLPGKSRHFSANEISKRLKSALKTFGLRIRCSVSKFKSSNTFLLTPY